MPPEHRSRSTFRSSLFASPYSLLLLALLVASWGCASRPIDEDVLTILYDRAASFQYPDRNPVIVIPGFNGSRLIDEETGEVVWGAFNRDALGFGSDEDLRRFALPLRPDDPRPTIRPDGVLGSIQLNVAGLPIEVKAYVPILQALGAGGYRDEALGETGAIDYGEDHYTCFQFDYDWRLDLAENAQRLHEFILAKREQVRLGTLRRFQVEPRSLRFDIVAHSLGGLLLRYYLRYGAQPLPEDGAVPEPTWAGAEYVDRAILVGPPNAGSAVAMKRMVEGVWFTPGVSTAVLGTWPSTYQMLPRARHGAVVDAADVVETDETKMEGALRRARGDEPVAAPIEARRLDPLDPDLWIRGGFGLADPDEADVLEVLLPDVADPDERRRIALDALRRNLETARRFQEALDRPSSPPPGTELHLITSDSIATEAVIALDLEASTAEVIEEAPGDGMVLRSSALFDERLGGPWQPKLRSPIDWQTAMFFSGKHFLMTRQPEFTNNLLYRLLEEPRRPSALGTPLGGPAELAGRDDWTAEEIVERLGLEPHPEGGFYRETYRTAETIGGGEERALSTAIYYLLVPDTFSEIHRLDADEVWHHYAGDPVEQLQLDPDAVDPSGRVVRLGQDLDAGERPQAVVPRGVWQGTRIVADGRHGWSLLGTTMAPGFEFEGYEAGRRDDLVARWPEYSEWVEALTRQ